MTRSMFLSVLFSALCSLSVAACAGLGTGQDDQSSLGANDCDRQSSGQTCRVDADCGQGEECEDGTCKLHGGACDGDSDDGSDDGSGDGSGGQCTTDAQCPFGQECEDGLCKPHGGGGGGGGDGSGGQCTTDAQCPFGQECEDGLCKPHGGAV